MAISQIVDHFFQKEYGKAVSYLTSRYGSEHLELAEDSVQEALMRAVQTWPYSRIPDNPSGWICKVAGNKMIDQLRRLQKQVNEAIPEQSSDFEPELSSIQDDMLRMLFACCHPSLSQEHQLVLTLKILGGLSIREISASLMKKEETIAKTYTRAKKKFRDQEIQLALPPAHQIKERLDIVIKIIYLLFNEGYKATEGTELIRTELCQKAMSLNQLLLESELCRVPTAYALMGLMHFQAARFGARITKDGTLVSLERQDRALWNKEMIEKGFEFLQIASNSDDINEYIIQAAINGIHCRASTFEETNWHQILSFYDLHLSISQSPMVRLNRIIPYAKVHGTTLALTELQLLEATGYFDEYYLFYAIKADLMEKYGSRSEAKKALEKAVALVKNERERHYLLDKLSKLQR